MFAQARVYHLVLDNCCTHHSKLIARIFKSLGAKVVHHFLPPYCPDHNRIEQVWLDLHANVTRNHRCKSLRQLLHNARVHLSAYQWRSATKARAMPLPAVL